MQSIQLDTGSYQRLLADWFRFLCEEEGIELSQTGSSDKTFTLGNPNDFHVKANFVDEPPFLAFDASDVSQQKLVDRIASEAADRVKRHDFGGHVWYSTTLNEVDLKMPPFSVLSHLLARLGSQTRISGWRRLGSQVLLEFVEEIPEGWEDSKPILTPKCVVKVHIAASGPCAGYFASHMAHSIVEVVAATCSFALGRTVELPPTVFSAKPEETTNLNKRQSDPKILTLARKGVSLDIVSLLGVNGGIEIFRRVRAALITYDAVVRQDRNPVSTILFVAAGECLTSPNTDWRLAKLTKRFVEFFDELMADDLDKIVDHANFEEAFDIRRGARTKRPLRRKLLNRIYASRSGLLHEGLEPSYGSIGLQSTTIGDIRRGLLADFAEAAILRYLESPRSSLIGHPGVPVTKLQKVSVARSFVFNGMQRPLSVTY